MKLKNSKRMKNGFTMVELIAIIAILAVIVAIAVPVSLSYVRNTRDKAFYLNVQEIVKKVKMENELNRGRHCYYNIDVNEVKAEEEEFKSMNQVATQNSTKLRLLSLIQEDKIKSLSILSYEGNDGSTKYAVLAQEAKTGDWINVSDFDTTSSEKSTWEDALDKDADIIIRTLRGEDTKKEELDAEEQKLLESFETGKKNELKKYVDDITKCELKFEEGN